MKYITLLSCAVLTAFSAFSQSWEAVKASPLYLYGEGWGVTVAEADRNALNDLISKITVQVSGSTSQTETETLAANGLESAASFNAVVKTYSSATLSNTEKVIVANEPDAHVGRWIKRADVDRIFEGRKHKIADYITSALKAEAQGKVDVALKDLYWAFCLTKTLQHPNEFKYTTDEGENLLVLTWVPRRMNEIFDDIKARTATRNGADLELEITYKGKPVNSLDYAYFDGRDWSCLTSARDGLGTVELAPGNEGAHLQLRLEFEYRGEAHIDKDVETVMQTVSTIPMRGAYKTITAQPEGVAQTKPKGNAKNKPEPPAADQARGAANTFASVSAEVYKMPDSVDDNARYAATLNKLAANIVSKRYDDSDALFTPRGREVYNSLIKYGRAKIVGKPQFTFYQNGDGVMARGLQMSFAFDGGVRKSFVEEVVFAFDPDGKIDNIAFGLGKTAEADILGKGVWAETARFAIMNFLENYQTAYALKRLDYISSVFDDDAVIITGSVTKTAARRLPDGQGADFGGDIIKYNRHTKDSYLKHLARSFSSNEYINIRFASNDVRKLGKGGELYAIQISQEYYSSHYGDKGYLFLMVDINDPDKPIIKVRTWQPEKDPNFGIYGPEHFK